MNKINSILLMTLIVLLAGACTTPGESNVTPEPTEAVSTAKVEPTLELTAEPAATEEAIEDTGVGELEPSGAAFDPATLRYPLIQVADGAAIILTSYSFDYTSDGGLQELADGYAAAMEPQGCGPYADSGSASGVSTGYLCLGRENDDMDDFTFSVGFAFEPEEARNVGLSFSSVDYPEFDLPIPDDAEEVDDWTTQATFNIAPERLEDMFLLIEAQNCKLDQELGSPEGGVYRSYVCLDESGRPLLILSVNYESAEVISVSMSFDTLTPEYVLTAFPEGARDFTYGADQTLRFSTPTAFERVYTFYSSEDEIFSRAECTLAGETGGAGGSTSMQFICTDYYSANFTYDFVATVVITEKENGSAVQLTFQEQ